MEGLFAIPGKTVTLEDLTWAEKKAILRSMDFSLLRDDYANNTEKMGERDGGGWICRLSLNFRSEQEAEIFAERMRKEGKSAKVYK